MNLKDTVCLDSNDPLSRDSKPDGSGYFYVIQDLDSGLTENCYTKTTTRKVSNNLLIYLFIKTTIKRRIMSLGFESRNILFRYSFQYIPLKQKDC